MSATQIHGTVDEGFGAVADAFAANFEHHGELGAAFALHVDGELKVDIHAGIADARAGTAWTDDTLQLVFSTTKGIAAMCVAILAERGQLDLTGTVADHWPEFGTAGKGSVTIEQMMSHQAGVSSVDNPPELAEVLAVTPIVDALAAQTPLWEPGTTHGYHALTYGWLVGELVRRVDGRRIGQFVQDEIAGPLGADFWIGLPEAEEARVSMLEAAPSPSDPEELALMMQVAGPGTMGGRALTLDGVFGMPAPDGDTVWNSRPVHASEIPAANGITSARSLSKIYAATVSTVDGTRLFNDDTVDLMRAERVHGPDHCLVVPSRFGAGFMLHGELTPMLSEGSFGHAGAGGSLGYADPDAKVGYGYLMNQMGGGIAGDPRTIGITEAVRACL